VWASENIFNDWDVASLLPQSRQPFVMTMNCLNGFFHFPAMNSLGEELVKAEGRGAIAAFSPSGLSLDEPAHLYHKAVLQEILSGRHARLGDAILAAQEDYARSGALPELLSIYQLLGDPALRLR
jgi:Peptidase family C25